MLLALIGLFAKSLQSAFTLAVLGVSDCKKFPNTYSMAAIFWEFRLLLWQLNPSSDTSRSITTCTAATSSDRRWMRYMPCCVPQATTPLAAEDDRQEWPGPFVVPVSGSGFGLFVCGSGLIHRS
jgi:hypothetical protein